MSLTPDQLEDAYHEATKPDRDKWLEARRAGVGSSDAAAVAGLSPWNTPYGVYCSKVFGVEKPSSPEMDWGLRLEPVIAAAFEEQTGLPLCAPPLQSHPDRPWQIASLDRAVVGANVPVELKTARSALQWGPAGTDEIPEHYLLQVTHQMVVTGADLAYLAALIGGADFRVYAVRLDAELAGRLTEIEAAFWDRVKSLDAPAPDWRHPSTPELLARLNVPVPGTELRCAAGSELHLDIDEYRTIRQEIADREKQKEELKARILHAMGTHSTLFLPDGTSVRRKLVRRAGYTVQPTEYVSFSVPNPKESK